MTKAFFAPGGIALALVLDLSACTNPYDPGQRAAVVALLAQEPAPRLAVRLAAEPARQRHPHADTNGMGDGTTDPRPCQKRGLSHRPGTSSPQPLARGVALVRRAQLHD